MGATAPSVEAVRRTLVRLVADPEDDLSERTPGGQCGPGRGHKFEDWEDIFVGLLLCEGHSQRSATFLINGDRAANAQLPVSRKAIRAAHR